MDTPLPLWALPVGNTATVLRLDTPEPLRRRLLDLGLTPGAAITCVGRSPGGDPSAYEICHAVVAIRRRDAAYIYIYPRKEEDYGAD